MDGPPRYITLCGTYSTYNSKRDAQALPVCALSRATLNYPVSPLFSFPEWVFHCTNGHVTIQVEHVVQKDVM
jgi:hypothetical protein